MWKAALAGAMLATTGASFCLANDYTSANYQESQRGPAVTEGHIGRLKAALQLTPEQQRYWPAVASALRGLNRAGSNAGGARAAVGAANAVRRVASAARPLLASLSPQQKQAGMQMINALGFGHLASAL